MFFRNLCFLGRVSGSGIKKKTKSWKFLTAPNKDPIAYCWTATWLCRCPGITLGVFLNERLCRDGLYYQTFPLYWNDAENTNNTNFNNVLRLHWKLYPERHPGWKYLSLFKNMRPVYMSFNLRSEYMKTSPENKIKGNE